MNLAPMLDVLREYGPMTARQICAAMEIEPTGYNVDRCRIALNHSRTWGRVEKEYIDGEVVWRAIE